MSKQEIRTYSSLVVSITLGLAVEQAVAQSGPQPTSSVREQGVTTLQEITVRAERFSVSVQTTPIAVTASNESPLAERAVTNVLEAMSEIPGITSTPAQSRDGTARVYLGGAGENSGGINYDERLRINLAAARAEYGGMQFQSLHQWPDTSMLLVKCSCASDSTCNE